MTAGRAILIGCLAGMSFFVLLCLLNMNRGAHDGCVQIMRGINQDHDNLTKKHIELEQRNMELSERNKSYENFIRHHNLIPPGTHP